MGSKYAAAFIYARLDIRYRALSDHRTVARIRRDSAHHRICVLGGDERETYKTSTLLLGDTRIHLLENRLRAAFSF